MQGVGAAEKVFEFIDRQPTMLNDGTLAPSQLEGKLEFKNVTFAYRTRPSSQVLQVSVSYLYIFGPYGLLKASHSALWVLVVGRQDNKMFCILIYREVTVLTTCFMRFTHKFPMFLSFYYWI